MRLLVMGPPGVGKGTQAKLLSEALGVPAVSTGDIFRANVADRTPLGLKVRGYLDAGRFVPDELTDAIVADRLDAADCASGFLLDGYPRTSPQARSLDDHLARCGATLDAVVLLKADFELLTKRLLARAHEEGRSDDTPEIIRRRLRDYQEQTAEVIGVYADRDLICQVDGSRSVRDVTDVALGALARRTKDRAVSPPPALGRRGG